MIYLRGLIAGLLVISAMFSLDYLTQSKYFPEFLISDASKERIEWYKQKAKEMEQEVEKRLERENNVSNN